MLTPKDEYERQIFLEFAVAAGLDVERESVSSGRPPQPDIRFTIGGAQRWVELTEITDEDLARKHVEALRTGVNTGGALSQAAPLARSITSKATKAYETDGSPLELVAYYDKQFPPVAVEPALIPDVIGASAAEMVSSGIWSRVWVYDSWSKSVLWVYPPGDGSFSHPKA